MASLLAVNRSAVLLISMNVMRQACRMHLLFYLIVICFIRIELSAIVYSIAFDLRRCRNLMINFL